MFALGIVDKLTPGSLTGGSVRRRHRDDRRRRARSAPIGGIPQKMIGARRNGATVFLVPGRRTAPRRARRCPTGCAWSKVDTLWTTPVASLRRAARPAATRRPARAADRRSVSPPASRPARRPARAPGRRPVSTDGLVVVRAHPQRAEREPSRSTATTSRTSWRSGCSASQRSASASSCGMSCSTAGGSISRSTASAAPSTSAGQTMPAEQLVEGRVLGQLVLVDRREAAGRVRRPRPSSAASWGSRRSRSAVSTRANRRGGWSQPAAAACRSMSRVSRSSRRMSASTILRPIRVPRSWELTPRVGKLTRDDDAAAPAAAARLDDRTTSELRNARPTRRRRRSAPPTGGAAATTGRALLPDAGRPRRCWSSPSASSPASTPTCSGTGRSATRRSSRPTLRGPGRCCSSSSASCSRPPSAVNFVVAYRTRPAYQALIPGQQSSTATAWRSTRTAGSSSSRSACCSA